jgi:predicted alpha/beta hydrolase family esterase
MSIEILPGFSPKNEEWAAGVQRDLEKIAPVTIVRWPHWDTQKTEASWLESEADKIVQRINDGRVTIIAKSVGTLVAMEVLRSKSAKVDKLILCGVPIAGFQEGDDRRFEVLADFDSNNVTAFQNEEDPHGKPEQIEALLKQVNPNIEVQSKPRNDHEYPYSADFIAFISEND